MMAWLKASLHDHAAWWQRANSLGAFVGGLVLFVLWGGIAAQILEVTDVIAKFNAVKIAPREHLREYDFLLVVGAVLAWLALWFLAWVTGLGQRLMNEPPIAGSCMLATSIMMMPAVLNIVLQLAAGGFYVLGFIQITLEDPWYLRWGKGLIPAICAGLFLGALNAPGVPSGERHKWEALVWWLAGALLTWSWWSEWAPSGREIVDESSIKLRHLTASACFAAGIVRWQWPILKRISRDVGLFKYVLLAVFGLCMFTAINWAIDLPRFGFRSGVITQGRVAEICAYAAIPFIAIAILKRVFGMGPAHRAQSWSIKGAGEYPSLTWQQEVGTGESIGQNQFRMTRIAQLIIVGLGVAIGAYVGSENGALVGLLIGGWLASLAPRDAAVPDLRLPIPYSGAAAPRAPIPLNEDERRQLAEPVTRVEDCAAFVEVGLDGKLLFCLARGDLSKGHLPIVDTVPWDSFQNFEEGTHSHWFRPRGVATNMLDWGVIIAQSNVGRVVRVAESVNDHASLTELLVKLQNTFIAPRDQYLKAFNEKMRASSTGSDAAQPENPPVDQVPLKPF